MSIPNILEMIDSFMNRCRLKGWEIIENETVVKSEGEYHNLIWIRELHPPTFERVAEYDEVAISDGAAYKTLETSYTAWICFKTSCESLMQIMTQKPELLRRNAVYDLSQAFINRTCVKLNETASEVFHDFERFLLDDLRIKSCSLS